jgi:hypothetical protein
VHPRGVGLRPAELDLMMESETCQARSRVGRVHAPRRTSSPRALASD